MMKIRRTIDWWAEAGLVLMSVSALACAPDRLPGERPGDSLESTGRASPEALSELDLARVEGVTLTIGDLDRRLASLSRVSQTMLDTAQRRSSFLEAMVQEEILARHATRDGLTYGTDEELRVMEAAAQLYLEETVTNAPFPELDDDAVAQLYAARYAELNVPERRQALVLVVDDSARAGALHAELVERFENQREPRRAIFARMVLAHSEDDATRSAGGLIPWFVSASDGGSANVALSEAIFALEEVGDISEPVPTARGWEIAMLSGVFEPREVSMDEARGLLIPDALLRHNGRVQYESLEALRASATVQIDAEMLAVLSSSRVDRAAEGVDPGARRFGVHALSMAPELFLGDEAVRELRERPTTFDVDAARPGGYVPPVEPELVADPGSEAREPDPLEPDPNAEALEP